MALGLCAGTLAFNGLKRRQSARRKPVTEKPETWLSRGAALPLEAIGPNEHMLTADEVLVEPIDIPQLLTQITDLMANRAYGRAMRNASETAA